MLGPSRTLVVLISAAGFHSDRNAQRRPQTIVTLLIRQDVAVAASPCSVLGEGRVNSREQRLL